MEISSSDLCSNLRKWPSATHPADLTIIQRVELDAHIKTCPSCAFIQHMDCILDEMVRALPFQKEPPGPTGT